MRKSRIWAFPSIFIGRQMDGESITEVSSHAAACFPFLQPEDADDARQEAACALLVKADEIEAADDPAKYAHTVARNAIRLWLRESERYQKKVKAPARVLARRGYIIR